MPAHRVAVKIDSLSQISQSPLLFLEVFYRLTLINLGLKFIPLKDLVKKLKKSHRRVPFDQLALIQKFAGILERHLFRKPSCLSSSLLLFWMAPAKSVISIGVLKVSQSIEAHAWLESQGQIFSGTEDYRKFEVLWIEHKE
jgi:hypothetical protein